MTKREHASEEIGVAVPRHTAWDTTVKLGAIEEASYLEPGDVVVAVDRAAGEVTVRRVCEKAPYGRSTGGM